ncbi:MAG: hypothetical protein FJY86_04190 [Candidatus Diapherotrites archaeon]|uniref:Prefoldin subunit alpha n=1 Tax=Candidatus Iainarchaeum sp. TaxID=3101447 RepID=A0A8T4C7R5_9ARCH|nr:hypothetical protein [Candidatus Diapherotrites archaeon]
MAETKKGNQQTITVEQVRYLRAVEKDKLMQLTKRKRTVMRMMSENSVVKQNITELGKGSKESIIPIGAGIYVSGTITANSFKRTLPGNVVLPSSMEDIEKELVEREKIYAKDLEQVDKEIATTRQNLQGMTALLKMSQKQGKKS